MKKYVIAFSLLLGGASAASAQYMPPGYVPDAPQVPDFSAQANPYYRPLPQMQVPQYQPPQMRQYNTNCYRFGNQVTCNGQEY
jgi:hypothetical protein